MKPVDLHVVLLLTRREAARFTNFLCEATESENRAGKEKTNFSRKYLRHDIMEENPVAEGDTRAGGDGVSLPPMDTVNPLAPKVWKQRLLTPSPERPVKG
jgi:hypothetical protein